MNEMTGVFLDGMLIENPVFMTFLGALAVAVLPQSSRGAGLMAVRIAVASFISSLAGVALVTAVPEALEPLVYLAVGLLAAGSLLRFGELQGEWLGLPKILVVLPLFIGTPYVASLHQELATAVAQSAGNSLGFVGAFVLIGAVRESVRISEARSEFKTTPVVLFTMAIFSLALTGFLFW